MEGRPYASRLSRLTALATALLLGGAGGALQAPSNHQARGRRVNVRHKRHKLGTKLQHKIDPKVKKRVRAKMARICRNAPGVVYINGRARIPHKYDYVQVGTLPNGEPRMRWQSVGPMYKTRKFA